MANQKIYVGTALRELRSRHRLTQQEFARSLNISVSYLNQMENNNRPIAAAVILTLARDYNFDISAIGGADSLRLMADLTETFSDSIFSSRPRPADLQLIASNTPVLARAILALHRSYRTLEERISAFNDALGTSASNPHPQPWEEVRDFFHYCDNYLDSIDTSAEKAAEGLESARAGIMGAIRLSLEKIGIEVEFSGHNFLRRFDERTRKLVIAESSEPATQLFQMAVQLGLQTQADLFEATLDMAHFQAEGSKEICRVGLANYFAGALLMPYRKFMFEAGRVRHDLETLARHFSVSIEQVAHRLSTLQRPGEKGIPFFFVRVDQAGNITKRHSATRLQFARFGGACPLWNVHRAFETPGQFLRQYAETPDGIRYFCLAYDVSKRGGSFHAPARRYAIGLGCEIEHASKLVYADHMGQIGPKRCDPIGISCRICPRENCHQRAVPPNDAQIIINENERGAQAYQIYQT